MTPRLLTLELGFMLALTSCSDPTAVALPLIGEWGDQTMSVTARASSVDISFGCSSIHIDAPLVPDTAGRFAFHSTYRGTFIQPQPIDIVGRVGGSRLLVDLTYLGQSPPITYHHELVRGVPSGPSTCLAVAPLSVRQRGLTRA